MSEYRAYLRAAVDGEAEWRLYDLGVVAEPLPTTLEQAVDEIATFVLGDAEQILADRVYYVPVGP